MSASSDLQLAIEQKLEAKLTVTLGDGVATELTVAHNFGTKFLYVSAKAGSTPLVLGTDYELEIVDKDTAIIVATGGAPALDAWQVTLTLLRVDVPVISRREKELASKISAAAANKGLCIFVMPPLPKRALQGNAELFFPNSEVRVRILEKPATNRTGADAYDIMDDVMGALHWMMLPMLGHPLQVAERPVEALEGEKERIFDVIFEAAYGQQPATTPTP